MKECCVDLSQRKEGPGPRGMDGIPEHEGISVEHCCVCECRHVEVELEPAQLGLTGQGL